MKFGKFVGLVLALGLGAVAQAQFAAYGTYTAERLTGMQCEDPQGVCSAKNGNINLTSGWGGLYYDFRNVGPVRLGVDVRAGGAHSNKSATTYGGSSDTTTMQSALAGIRASFHTPIKALKPYAQISAGWARSNVTEYPLSTIPSGTFPDYQVARQFDPFLVIEGFAGVDVKLLSVVDFRPIELGIGNMHRLGGNDPHALGVANGVTSVGVESIGIGLVFHLPQ
jgi:hypothetical protein